MNYVLETCTADQQDDNKKKHKATEKTDRRTIFNEYMFMVFELVPIPSI